MNTPLLKVTRSCSYPFVAKRVTEKNTFRRTVLKFISVIWMTKRKAGTTKWIFHAKVYRQEFCKEIKGMQQSRRALIIRVSLSIRLLICGKTAHSNYMFMFNNTFLVWWLWGQIIQEIPKVVSEKLSEALKLNTHPPHQKNHLLKINYFV